MKRRTFTSLALIAATPGALWGCAAGPLITPGIAGVVNKALVWLQLIDSFVQTLKENPNVPREFREAYDKLKMEFAKAAVVVQDLIDEGQKSHERTLQAVAVLQEIGKRIVDLLRSFRYADAQGNLIAPDGNTVGLRAPEPVFAE